MTKNQYTPVQVGKSHLVRQACFLILILILTTVMTACGDTTSQTPGATSIPSLEKPRGETLFMRYCNVCHPGGGRGSGPSLKTLPLTREDVSAYIRHGKGRMPGFGPSAIPDEDVDALVDYVLALR
jgi:mono/diheme cytochrome c family protein